MRERRNSGPTLWSGTLWKHLPGEKELVRDDGNGIGHVIQIAGGVLDVPPLPCEICGVGDGGLELALCEYVKLLDEAIIKVNLWTRYIYEALR